MAWSIPMRLRRPKQKMSDNQTKRFHRLISEGRIVFKAAAYTQSEDGEHPEHITFKLDFSSSDSVAVFGV